MGVMTKMRDNTAIVLYILIGSFGLLWVVMDVYDPNVTSMGPRSLGEVNGEPISLEEYNSRVQYYTNAYSQQSGSAITPEIRAIYESQVWEELVSTKLLEQKMDELGITVTDSELLDMVFGDTPDPLIRQYFQREDGMDNLSNSYGSMSSSNNRPGGDFRESRTKGYEPLLQSTTREA